MLKDSVKQIQTANQVDIENMYKRVFQLLKAAKLKKVHRQDAEKQSRNQAPSVSAGHGCTCLEFRLENFKKISTPVISTSHISR